LGFYIKEFFKHPTELIVPVFVSGKFSKDMFAPCEAVIDPGSNFSLIEEKWMLDELHLVARTVRGTVYQPQVEEVKMVKAQKEDMEVVDIFAAIGNPSTRIEGSAEATVCKQIDKRPSIKIILGMDFLKTISITYIAGRQGAIFGLLQPL
jgi:hypothetical protein